VLIGLLTYSNVEIKNFLEEDHCMKGKGGRRAGEGELYQGESQSWLQG